jgi:Fe-S cluster biogenesis protein NfuA
MEIPMTTADQDTELQSRMRQLDTLLQEADAIADPAARAATGQVIQALMDFHGAAVSRIVARLGELGELGRNAIDDMADDELIGSLLLLYNVHPHDLPTRVNTALEKVRPVVRSQGGTVELEQISDDGVVQLTLRTSGKGCASTAGKLKAAVEQAITDRAPDVTAVRFQPDEPRGGFVPVELVVASAARHHAVQGALP